MKMSLFSETQTMEYNKKIDDLLRQAGKCNEIVRLLEEIRSIFTVNVTLRSKVDFETSNIMLEIDSILELVNASLNRGFIYRILVSNDTDLEKINSLHETIQSKLSTIMKRDNREDAP